jgi:RNA polymerase sigma-70 factor (ECF subfamily)
MKNHKEIFSQIYDSHVEKIFRFIFLKVNSQDIAQDLCSETFLRAWESFKDNNKKIDNPNAFLYQVTRNFIIDHYREKGRTQTVSADYVPIIDPAQDLEKKTLQDSDMGMIQSELNNLKPEYQEVIIWHYIEDLSIPEIAKMIDKKEGTVRVKIHRALKALKNKIEQA